MTERTDRIARLHAARADRILVLDGAMGTMIQRRDLTEEDFRKGRDDLPENDLLGNNDLLSLTRPDVVSEIHTAFLEAGCDIVCTNTFSATAIAQADYGAEALVPELNQAAARIACEAAYTASTDERPRFVAGSLGPTNKTASLSPDVNDPGFRAIYFDALKDAYREAAEALIAGGVDLLLIETVFDTLNAKAAVFAAEEAFEAVGERLPLMISGTITDRSGRTLTGQTPEAFWISLEHARPFSFGLNCALGAKEMRSHVAELAAVADTLICAYPNAGLPNELGGYDETPEETAGHLAEWARDGLVNLVGGCCGTTPDHIRAICDAICGATPRPVPAREPALRLSGLERFELRVQ